jgi:ABC-2 type transport system ATP-binding protein
MSETIIDVRGVHKRFGDVHALAGVDLQFQRGMVYGLLGPNGAGKTTLINVLATLTKPDEGSATVAGFDVVEDAQEVRRTIGLAGQFAAVDDYLTGRETVEMIGRLYGLPSAEARSRAEDVLGRFNLLEAADRPSKGYSGGMRRRLDLAASLVGEPQLLYLDEPTTGIDPGSRVDIWDLINELVAGGTTVLLTTQYLEEADALADRIGVINQGRLISEGTADELKDSMGSNVIRLRVGDDDVEDARSVLSEIGEFTEEARGTFSTPATQGNRTLLEVVRRLDARDLEPLDLALERPSLDDVFLTLTGSDTGPDRTDDDQDAAAAAGTSDR